MQRFKNNMSDGWLFKQELRLFRNEMLRIGIDEAGQCERVCSPIERIYHEVQMGYPGLAARIRECMTSPHHSSKEMDFAFFRLVVDSKRRLR